MNASLTGTIQQVRQVPIRAPRGSSTKSIDIHTGLDTVHIRRNIKIYSRPQTLLLCLGTHRIVAQSPSDVTNIQITDPNESSFKVSWTAPSGESITNYTVIINNGANKINETITTTTTYQASGLQPGITYTVTIRANNGTGTSSGVIHNAATLPSPVMGLAVSFKSSDSVTLQWTFSSDTNSKSYTYTVSYGGGNKTGIVSNTTVIQSLTPGTEYNFTVSAVTSNGVSSDPSKVVTTTTLPSPVMGLKVSSKSSDNVTLQWTFSSDNNSKSYTYTVSYGGGNKNGIVSDTTVIQNLTPGTEYNFTVSAVTSNGVSSDPSKVVTTTTLPSPVTGLKVSSKSSDNVTLQWTFSSDNNSKSYTYTVSYGGGNKTNITSNNIVIQSLTPGTEYNFTVSAVTSNGVSSDPSTVVTTTTLPSPVMGLAVSFKSSDNVTLQWTFSSDNNSKSYTYTVSYGGGNKTNITSDTTVIQNLTPGTEYNFTVSAVTSNGVSSDPSKVVTTTTLPSPVTGLVVSSKSSDSVTLQWTFSSDNNSKSYTYTVSYGGGNKNGIVSNTTVIQSLTPGTEYNFTVSAVTSNGVSSDPSTVVTTTTQPNIVRGVTVLNVSETSVAIQWSPSQDTNNNTYTYTVNIQGQNSTNITNPNIKSNSFVVTSLLPGVDYSIKVFAVTKNGVPSQPSETVNTATIPSPVTGLAVSLVTSDSVTLQWTFSSDFNSKSYTYTVSYGGGNKTGIVSNTTVIQNLTPGTEYNFTVSAVTSNGVSSNPSTVVTNTTHPNIVQGVAVVNKSETTVTLRWNLSQDPNRDTYTYTVEVQGQNFSIISNIKSDNEVVTSLLPGVDYSLKVVAVTKNGVPSQPSETVTTTTMPNAPSNLQGNAVNVSEIYITWTAPDDVNKKSYDYTVTWAEASQNIASTTTKDTFLDVKDLHPGHLYNITVKSVIKNTASVSAQIYTATNPLSTQGFSAGNVTNSSVMLTWTIPNSPDSTVTGYRVTVLLNGSKDLEEETSEKTYLVNNLQPGYIYSISVESYARYPRTGRATRALDNFITSYSTPSTIKVETVPDVVTELICSKVDAYQISVGFKCPRGNYSAFKVLVNNVPTNDAKTCSENVVVSNLQPAASYNIRVITLATEKNATTLSIICSTDNTGVIVGSIFGVLLFILLIALIAFLVLRKRRSKDSNVNIPTTMTKGRRFHTIPREKFKQHYENNHADSDFGFAEEYQELSSVGTTQSKRAAELPDNKAKNRFTNVLPYDHSRVKLSIMNGILTSDYINANYMPGYNSTKEYIACQGPLPNTTADFWRMVWEHHVNTIVMLTNCIESGRVKCEHYWPLDYTPCTYGDLTVTVTPESETILSEWTIRDFSVRHATEPGVKSVRHFHFTAWPDHGVPDSTSSITQFHNLVREYMDQRKSNGPTVVHCSAGVGRTGTLIALDYLIQQNEREHRIGVYGFVEKMRMNRNLMVQTEAQYIFLNKCMLDLIDQPEDEHIYENHTGNELVYENVSAIRNLQRENA